MYAMRLQSATPKEWSDFIAAARCVAKDLAADKACWLEPTDPEAVRSRFDFTESAPQCTHLEDANECIARLWSVCIRLSNKNQLIRDRVAKDSSNSSSPPSTDSLRAKITRQSQSHHRPTGRRHGGQVGHLGRGRKLLSAAQVDEVIACPAPAGCVSCGCALSHVQVSRRKQVSYLKDKRLVVREFQIYRGDCPKCHGVYRGQLPVGTPTGAFGACVLSMISTLTGRYRLSKRQVSGCLKDLFGLKISVGSISNAEHQVSQSLEVITSEVHESLKLSSVNHADETTHYHRHRLYWMWLLANEQLVYFSIHRRRNQEIAQCLLGSAAHKVWVTDRYVAYGFLPKKQHQYCWSHLKRDIKAMLEERDCRYARIGTRLEALRRLIFREYRLLKETRDAGDPRLGKKMRRYLKHFRRMLRDGVRLCTPDRPNVFRNLIRDWRCLWNFLLDDGIPATNNHAERLLRHNVLWRKLSLGTQSRRGDRYVERISTVHLSCRLQGRDLLRFLEVALEHFWSGHDPPSLLPSMG